jgi:integrase
MAVDDLWYLRKRGDDGKRIPSKRHGRGKRYRVRYTDPNTGKPLTESFDKKATADLFDANVRADISKGQYLDVDAGKVTVKDYSERWRAQQVHRDATAARIESQFRLHVYGDLGELAMAKVKPSHIQKWVKARMDDLSPSSLMQVFTDLKAMFEDAVGECIPKNPCKGASLPEIEAAERYIPSAKEVHALSEAFGRRAQRFRAIPLLAAGTGLRPSEIRGLELGHVDFLRRTVRVEQQVLWSKAHGVHVAKVKTKTSRRTVEMPQVALDALARHVKAFPPVDIDMEDVRDPRKPIRRPVKLLFTSTTGRPMHNGGYWHRHWSAAVKDAGLPEGFGLHGLRHLFATALIHAGRSVKVVQLALGHSSPTITLNTYVHEWPGQDERTRDVLDAALAVDEPEQDHG